MTRRIVTYALVIAVIAALIWAREGARAPEPGNLVATLLLLPLFAWLIWLRWDWAPEAHLRRQRDERKGGAAPTDNASPSSNGDVDATDAAERP